MCMASHLCESAYVYDMRYGVIAIFGININVCIKSHVSVVNIYVNSIAILDRKTQIFSQTSCIHDTG